MSCSLTISLPQRMYGVLEASSSISVTRDIRFCSDVAVIESYLIYVGSGSNDWWWFSSSSSSSAARGSVKTERDCGCSRPPPRTPDTTSACYGKTQRLLGKSCFTFLSEVWFMWLYRVPLREDQDQRLKRATACRWSGLRAADGSDKTSSLSFDPPSWPLRS